MTTELSELEICSGMKFGDLTTQWSYGSGYNKKWKCLCSCGNICYVKEGALLNGITKDCGGDVHKIKNTNMGLNRPVRKFIVIDGVAKHVCLKCNADMPDDSRKIYCDQCRQSKKENAHNRYKHFFKL